MERVEPRYASILIDKIVAHNLANPKPHAFDTPFRHSDGGGCTRFLAFKAAGIEDSDPFDFASHWVAHIGTMLHEEWQEACAEVIDCEAEVKVHDENMLASGSADLTEKRTVVEYKSIDGMKFAGITGIYKRSVKSKRTKPKGPVASHVIQLALNVVDADADWGVLSYVVTGGAVSKQVLAGVNSNDPDPMTEKDRICAEYRFSRAELQRIADAELHRLKYIKHLADNDLLPEAMGIGDDFESVPLDPWSGDNWQCWYCTQVTRCKGYKAGQVSIRSTTDKENYF